MKKGFIITIIPSESNGKVRSVFISPFLIKFLLFTFFSIFILNSVLLYHFFNFEIDKNKLNFLIKENETLSKKIEIMKIKNDSLTSKIEKLVDRINKLRSYAGLEPFEEDLLKMGIGGELLPREEKKVLEERIDYMLNLASEFEKKINEMENYVENKKKELEHTPSISPVGSGWIVSGYGYRRDPFTGKVKLHEGVDISSNYQSPVQATANGRVVFAGWKEGYGLTVEIDHGNGFKTKYAHNSRILVQVGQSVKRGEIIALMGSTGRATGVHVHYEVQLFNKPINPLNYIIPDHLYFD
ncbi:MAG: M23 family metallopeptidase [candidate division WOR-3 bacterium]